MFRQNSGDRSEDLGAHYKLTLVYRKLGWTEEAEAKIFADLKDDPGALSLANQFLRKLRR